MKISEKNRKSIRRKLTAISIILFTWMLAIAYTLQQSTAYSDGANGTWYSWEENESVDGTQSQANMESNPEAEEPPERQTQPDTSAAESERETGSAQPPAEPENSAASGTQTVAPPEKPPAVPGRTLEDKYGDLSGSTQGYEAVRQRINGNVLTLDIFVNFTGSYMMTLEGKTYAALAKEGFMLWQGEFSGSKYDFEQDMRFSVRVNIHDIYNGAGARSGQNYFNFHCVNASERGFTNYGVGFYDRAYLGTSQGAIPYRNYTNGAIVMYNRLGSLYTANQYIKVSAHEFGHVLGLGDQYGKGLPHTAEIPLAGSGKRYIEGDIMGGHGYVTPNDIEMALEAYVTDDYQAFVNDGYEKRSGAIKGY
ncbi:MAG: hypothetical protein LBQ48_01425 [Oscillospiraceae bacterium]|jgi:hypothetical protein|nr:hypothetical protein [Oscillospiraceae bacterium]